MALTSSTESTTLSSLCIEKDRYAADYDKRKIKEHVRQQHGFFTNGRVFFIPNRGDAHRQPSACSVLVTRKKRETLYCNGPRARRACGFCWIAASNSGLAGSL